MNIFTSNKVEQLTQQVAALSERVQQLEYILKRYPPPYNPYFIPPQDIQVPTMLPNQPNFVPQNYVPPNHFPVLTPDKWSNNQ